MQTHCDQLYFFCMKTVLIVEKEHLSRVYVLFVTIIYSLVYYYLVTVVAKLLFVITLFISSSIVTKYLFILDLI